MKIILASKSPRRREILENLGIEFEIITADADESSDITDPDLLVSTLARRKGRAVLDMLGGADEERMIIACDTLVYANGEFLQSLPLTSYATYKKIVEKAETDEEATLFDLSTLTISNILVCGISSTKDDITIDNVTFICGEPIITEENTEEGAE